MKSPRIQSFVVILTTAITITVNALANILPFNGQTSAQVSDKYFTAFTPAGYAFAIWSVIYTGLIIFSIYQVLPSQLTRFQSVRPWVILSNIANALWLPLFHYEVFSLSIVVIVILLFSLLRINQLLDPSPILPSDRFIWFAQIPFNVYFGWVSVATIANVCVALTAAGWNAWGLPHEQWAMIILTVGIGVAALVQSQFCSYMAYLLVFVWAYWSIAEGQPNLMVQQTAQLGAFVALALIVYRFVRGQQKTP